MISAPIPWKILSATHGVGVLTPDWNLSDPVSVPEESRLFLVDVLFSVSFASPPVVHLGLSGFDIDQHESARLTIKVGEITEFGFQAVISTWSTTRVYAAEFSWLAVGA
ncbi:MAG: H-type lectin domain-containing protein [Verrucomicrobia bacterium]|nr:H-type lectin domain-containing protein [Verrucomicrobiota bacterium]